jgi:hypothetical protein
LLQPVWNKDVYEGFLFNYSFIHRIYYKLRTNGGAYEYLEAPHRQAFMPLMSVIEKNMRGMDLIVTNIAKELNTQPQSVYLAFGLELDANGILNENKIQKIANGRLRADDYWMRHPGNTRSVNEWYNARDPQFLFEKFYPQYISEFISDIPKIIALAKNFEDQQIQAAQKREERQRWLQTAEGKKFLADEEAKRKKEESDRVKAEAVENARIAKEFPYVARFTCTTNGYPVNFISCLYGRVNTEIEIQNGREYKLYQGAEFSNKFPDDKGAKVVNLRSKFSITAQNAAENLILGVKILDRKTGATVFEKQASQLRAINVSN